MSITTIRQQTAQRMGDANTQCTRCGTTTAYATLSSYGARCSNCYVAYCQEPRLNAGRSMAADSVRKEIAELGRRVPE